MAWILDTAHSLVEFSVRHMMISKVRGGFRTFNGTLELDEQNPENSVVEGTIDVNSIDTREAQRDAHLRSADFFDTENFPTMHFRSTKVQHVGDEQYKVTGDMTIKDRTHEVVFNVTDGGSSKDPWGNHRRGFSATTKINREDFDLTWNVILETGGWAVGKEININIDIEAIRA